MIFWALIDTKIELYVENGACQISRQFFIPRDLVVARREQFFYEFFIVGFY